VAWRCAGALLPREAALPKPLVWRLARSVGREPDTEERKGAEEKPGAYCLEQGTDLSVHTVEDLARYARSLNDRPRKTLGYPKPSERLDEVLAHTG
jgi:hypothetical protein